MILKKCKLIRGQTAQHYDQRLSAYTTYSQISVVVVIFNTLPLDRLYITLIIPQMIALNIHRNKPW